MTRPRPIDKGPVAKARQVVAHSTDLEQLRAAQAVLLPALVSATLEQTAAILGVGRATVARLQRRTRAQSFTVPSPDIFPADLYTELGATEWIEVEDSLANAFYNKDTAARTDVLKLAEARINKLGRATEYISGVIGLRLHRKLVSTSSPKNGRLSLATTNERFFPMNRSYTAFF